ncbi:MAG: S41 family peptidase [Candidatus Eremiobacteraeota bacterium]|nr:S41 family peptidase [Candidatus Eremiobacteraeota bacterium]
MKRLPSLVLIAALLLAAVHVPSASAAALAPLETDELQMSYQRLTTDFYKKVNTQELLDGARTQLLAYLEKNGVKKATLPAVHARDNPAENVRELDREVALAANAYGSRFGTRAITYAAISGLLGAVKDKYTVFLTPKEYADLNAGLDGATFSGVGIVIGSDERSKMITVSNVVPNGPAEKAGLQPDDVLSLIDGRSTKNMTIQQASGLLRGKEGTTVHLTIERNGAAVAPITIVRAQIRQLSVYQKMLPSKIGYVELTVFGRETARELTGALERLAAQGAKAFILDLRDNGGGYLDSAIEVSSKFIANGPIVSVESRAGNVMTYDSENTAISPVPLAVLVNGHTASASEITSGAIQDSGVGTLVGTKTYGKGVVQTIYPLPDGSAVKITTARYLTPHNRDINIVGIQPDVTTEENKNPRYGIPERDSQLQTAITLLQAKIARYNS